MNGINSTFLKTIIFLLLVPASFLKAQKFEFSMKELVSFTSIPTNKFDSYISRKGYKVQPASEESSFNNAFYKVSKDHSIQKILGRYDRSDTSSLFFQTNSIAEFNELKNELKENGFVHASYDSTKKLFPPMYQRGSIRVIPSLKQDTAQTIYSFEVQRKELPKPSEVAFAEDLMSLVSHEYLAAVFGPSNVKKDVYYFSEKDLTRCSVLFPNTNLQVVFIWKDEENQKEIDYMLIGGQVRTQGSQAYHKTVEMNKWRSTQGIYLGMTLRDLEQLNGAPIEFYGWDSEQPGIVSPKNKGKIDFKKLGVQLNCLDCNEDKYYSKNNMLNSTEILQQNGRVYVSMLILVPGE